MTEDMTMTMSAHPKKPLEPTPHRPQERERLNLLAHLAGSVSHAIQSPLTTILLHADILEEELRQLQEENRQHLLYSLGMIKEEVARLHDLAEQYLLLARLPALPREPEDLGVLLESLLLERRERLVARGIVFQLEGSDRVGPVALRKKSLQRALLNLLDYAIQMMPTGGSITLRASRMATEIQLEMSYTGEVMAPEHVSQLLHAPQNSDIDQAALGLFMASQIVNADGGTITVASTPGMGTSLIVTLPL
jgi:signal transduction histidine kinase